MLRTSKCCLHGKSDDEIAAMKECIYDPGGYFIIKGVEKAMLMQEQLSKVRFLLDLSLSLCLSLISVFL
jgi:DNA-directed RNA polymerase III subunit RPC2